MQDSGIICIFAPLIIINILLRMGKRLFLSLSALFLAFSTMLGGEVTINGIKYYYSYTISSSHLHAEVIVVDGKSKEGVVEIPSYIYVDDGIKLFVTEIGRYAFDGNTKITKVSIPGSTTIIDTGAFRDCSSLETVAVETVTLYDDVFKGEDFDFNGLTYIWDQAFSGCTNLKSINLPETLTTIGDDAFSECKSLTTIDLPSSLRKLGSLSGPFGGCTSLKSVSIPADVKTICYRAFIGCTSLESVVFKGAINGVGEGAFWKCSSLKSIDLSKGVRELGQIAFMESGIESIILPETGLEKIGGSCFAGSQLKSIEVPASVTFIGGAFCGNCTSLGEAVIRGGVYSSSESGQFTGCINLKRATITWTGELSGKMFNGCSGLETVILGGDITAIGGNAFNSCTSLKTLTIPNTVASIKYSAFQNCIALENITIPSSVTEIYADAFKGCTSIQGITIPSGVTDLSNGMFEGCIALKDVFLPSGMTRIGYGSFKDCSMLEQLELPSNLVTIDYDAFKGCSSLKEQNLPSHLETVNSFAFSNCSSLKSLKFPASMKTLGNYAFSGCNSMELIDLRASRQLNITSTERTGVFGGVPESTVILLPGDESLTPIEDQEEINFAVKGSLNETTDLSGTVIDNIYFNVAPGNGGFDAEEKCVVVNKAMTDEDIEAVFASDLFSDEVKATFVGMVIEVPVGKGKVSVEAQTTGGMTLKVKIGAADPVEMALEGKLKMKFPYNVTEPTLVYIYAGEASAATRRINATRGELPELRIYGIGVEAEKIVKGDADGDGEITDADVAAVASYIMGTMPMKFVFAGADSNGDGEVNVADIVDIINKKE